jgi:hypothetical protein
MHFRCRAIAHNYLFANDATPVITFNLHSWQASRYVNYQLLLTTGKIITLNC